MSVLVPDTSALVSLGVVAEMEPDPLSLCLRQYDVRVPERVIGELEAVGSYDDGHGEAAARVLDRRESFSTRSVELDTDFPLDDGENAAVTLANELAADLLLCDEFNSLGLIHASLADTRLVTTPTLLSVFTRRELLATEGAQGALDEIAGVRSWSDNSYVERARSLLETE